MTIGFPEINASLNALAAVLLVAGYVAIKIRWIQLHKVCMLAAVVVSTLFLSSYLYYHFAVLKGKATYFADRAPSAPDWVRYLYYAVLGSHTLLAMPTAPLALVTAWLGLRGTIDRHVRLARWTLPIWLYVAVTGVVVYWMLYRLYT